MLSLPMGRGGGGGVDISLLPAVSSHHLRNSVPLNCVTAFDVTCTHVQVGCVLEPFCTPNTSTIIAFARLASYGCNVFKDCTLTSANIRHLDPDVLNHDLYAKDMHCSPPGVVDHMWAGVRRGWLPEEVISSFSYFLSLYLHPPSEGYMF